MRKQVFIVIGKCGTRASEKLSSNNLIDSFTPSHTTPNLIYKHDDYVLPFLLDTLVGQ